jgi:hypothetical protein
VFKGFLKEIFMQNTDERKEMVCPLTHPALMCISGRREDFPKDKIGTPIQCRYWVHLYGKDPQSDKTIDQWDCCHAWMPTLITEAAQMARQNGAATEQVRNLLAQVIRPQPPELITPPPAPALEN